MIRAFPAAMVVFLAACGGGAGQPSCPAGTRFCDGNDVRACMADGEGSVVVGFCSGRNVCRDGACVLDVDFPDVPGDARTDVGGTDVRTDAADPGPADPGVVDPGAADPGGVDAAGDPGDPGGADPGGADTAADPGADDPGLADVAVDDADDPGPTDPGGADDGPPDPGGTDAGRDLARDPGPEDPGGADPGATDPGPTDPGPADPGPGDPGGDAGPPCGNGRLDPGEDCDGALLGGATCASLKLGLSGVPRCLDDCRFDTLPCGGHALGYTPVKNVLVTGGFVDVAWHPDGSYALLAARGGEIVKYDAASGDLSLVGDTGTTSPSRVAFAPSGVAYVVGAIPGGAGRVFRVPDGAGALEAVAGGDSSAARWVAIDFPRGGGPAVLVGQANSAQYYYTGYIATWDPATEVLQGFKGFSTGAGVSDFTFVEDPTLLSVKGYAGLVTCGANGKDAYLWMETGNVVSGNTNSEFNSFGNMGRAAWRPGGAYGLVSGTSSAILYVFSGTWTKSYLNTSQAGSSVHDVFFRDDGRRGIVIGASFGGTAHLLDHRPTGTAFGAADLVPMPLDGWNDSPWFADDASLNAGAFRPGVACDEGLLVGEGPGPSYSPGFGMVARFRDTDAHDCPNP